MAHQDLIDDLRDLATRYAKDSAMTALCSESADAIAALRAEVERLREERRWIPVTERLPASQRHVAGLSPDDGDSKPVRYSGGYWWGCDGRRISVTHWQPLPAPPAKEE